MQLQLLTTYTAQSLGFAAISEGLAVVEEQGYARLIYSSRNDNRVGSVVIEPVAALPRPALETNAPGADLAFQATSAGTKVYVFSAYADSLGVATLAASGAPGNVSVVTTGIGQLAGVTAVELFEGGATDLAVVAQRGVAGLQIFSISEAGAMALIGTIEDTPKAYLGDISDLAGVTIGADRFLLVLSALENGLTSYRIDASGGSELMDSLGNRDGLAITGPAVLQMAVVGGQNFAVIGSTQSDSLSVVRINAMGALFQTDHLIDSRDTRFAKVAALDLFETHGRSFVLAAGTDSGLSLVELLPGGALSHVQSFALETGAGIGAVTAIEAAVLGNKVAVFLTDASGAMINRYDIALTTMGDLYLAQGGTVTGSALDDRIIGSGAAETLQGGAGDDFIHDGGGADVLLGGAGADVFVFAADGAQDRIADFTDGVDRIDLSAWGRVYSASALTIQGTATGARISYGNEVLLVDSAQGTGLSAATLTDADFLF